MRFLKRLFKLLYPVGYVLALLSIRPLQIRNLTVGMIIMLPNILFIISEEIRR